MSNSSVMIPKSEYDTLRQKADLFDKYIETEELDEKELLLIKKALQGPLITKSEFLNRNPDLT